MAKIASKSRARRLSVHERVRCIRALLDESRTTPLSARVNTRARRFGYSSRTIWRWLARFRRGGANALRDSFRRDALTRRARPSPTQGEDATRLTSLGSVMLGDRFVFRTVDVFAKFTGRKPGFEGKELVVDAFMAPRYASRVSLRTPDGGQVLLPLEIVEKFLDVQRARTH